MASKFWGCSLYSQLFNLWHGMALALLVVLGVTHPGCDQADPTPLRIGVTPWPGHAYVYLAQELGYFEEEGCQVRLLEFSSRADAQRAYLLHQLHGMYGTQVELLQIRDRDGHRPCAVHITDYSHGGDALVAQADISSVRELSGRRIGCEPGSVSLFVLAIALREAGLTLGEVELVTCDQHELQQRFQQGALAAVMAYPPVSHTLLDTPGAHVLYSTRRMPEQVLDLLFVETDVAQARSHEIAGLIRAFERAVAFARQQPREAARIMAPSLQMSVEELQMVLERELELIALIEQQEYFEGGRLQDILEQSVEVLRDTGQLQGEVEAGACYWGHPLQLVLQARPPSEAVPPDRVAADTAEVDLPLKSSAP